MFSNAINPLDCRFAQICLNGKKAVLTSGEDSGYQPFLMHPSFCSFMNFSSLPYYTNSARWMEVLYCDDSDHIYRKHNYKVEIPP